MWNTPGGEARILTGPEWELFRNGVGVLHDQIEESLDGRPLELGIRLFDSLQPNQQLAMLADVADAMCDENIEPPPLTAISEATIAAVFQAIRGFLVSEVEMNSEGTIWRRMLLAACSTTHPDDSEPLPIESSADLDEWSFLLDCMEETILWDFDFDSVEHADLAPEIAAALKQQLGIDPDYYAAIPPDPHDSELEGIRARLRARTMTG